MMSIIILIIGFAIGYSFANPERAKELTIEARKKTLDFIATLKK